MLLMVTSNFLIYLLIALMMGWVEGKGIYSSIKFQYCWHPFSTWQYWTSLLFYLKWQDQESTGHNMEANKWKGSNSELKFSMFFNLILLYAIYKMTTDIYGLQEDDPSIIMSYKFCQKSQKAIAIPVGNPSKISRNRSNVLHSSFISFLILSTISILHW